MIKEKLLELMNYRNMNMQQLSDYSGLSVETIKNLVYGRVSDPKLSTLFPLCEALNCSLDYLTGHGRVALQQARDFPNHSIKFVEQIVNAEYLLNCRCQTEQREYRTVIVPSRFAADNMIYDSSGIGIIDVSAQLELYSRETITCGAFIQGNELEPVFYDGDILLINCERHPYSNEMGVWLSNDKLYIRRYLYGENGNSRLCPIQNRGTETLMRNGKFQCFGTILGVYRGEMEFPDTKEQPHLLPR